MIFMKVGIPAASHRGAVTQNHPCCSGMRST
jgi:hypothetical protein